MVSIVIEKETCILCGECVEQYPEIFRYGANNDIDVISGILFLFKELLEIASVCPMDSISLNQLDCEGK